MSAAAGTGAGRNRSTAALLLALAFAMVGAAYAAVPFYQWFCQVTGFGGTTRVATAAPLGTIDRLMTTRFDANVDAGLPWRVAAARPQTAPIGAVRDVFYTVENLSNMPVTGTAAFNVTPERSGGYFNKIQCFCFTEQRLEPGEIKKMQVTFFVDPAIDNEAELQTVRDITLSYTFYAAKDKGS